MTVFYGILLPSLGTVLGKNAPMKKMIETAKKARCHDFIMALPNGYETIIEEGGAGLSDGKIAQSGTHEQLMEQGGIYRRFVESGELAVGWKV